MRGIPDGWRLPPGRWVEMRVPRTQVVSFSTSHFLPMSGMSLYLKGEQNYPNGFYALATEKDPMSPTRVMFKGVDVSWKNWTDYLQHGTLPQVCRGREE